MITLNNCQQATDKDLPQFIDTVNQLPNVARLNSNQFAALVDFAFNTGNSLKYLDEFFEYSMGQSDFSAVCTELLTAFTKPDGKKPSRGKINRRKAESALCSTPTNVMSGCITSRHGKNTRHTVSIPVWR
jgi:GH24 family phage-related lysozyme (muramidase)